jgi:DNA-binding HxlR family transcriptional regulator
MRRKSFNDNVCPVARSLDIVGEWWSLLIIRDAMLGVRRFSDFQRRLGLAKNILVTRLKHLVAAGVMQAVPASDGSLFTEYVLTEKGKDLLPTLVALRQWGEKYLFAPTEQRTALVDRKYRKPLRTLEVKSQNGKACAISDIDLITPSVRVKAQRK